VVHRCMTAIMRHVMPGQQADAAQAVAALVDDA
jgi:hypothetical protein